MNIVSLPKKSIFLADLKIREIVRSRELSGGKGINAHHEHPKDDGMKEDTVETHHSERTLYGIFCTVYRLLPALFRLASPVHHFGGESAFISATPEDKAKGAGFFSQKKEFPEYLPHFYQKAGAFQQIFCGH